ncbi:dipeptide ABC transporter ATP-binding protein DppD [Pararhodobacter marinus]|uniref:Dipeptide ABC transporter ATP-binding protein DppD n=1 Tax=Pararhodobacter marinus TaxID=2184063 RepID=A0A2U2CFW0_9RHOB|nr:ABC transporter ATP-binding protein [Pararhodobacter marinus]PWE30775.1 dipeptide ABC transporter ATP-binding protein DppD [Pararhodobacter marinus]
MSVTEAVRSDADTTAATAPLLSVEDLKLDLRDESGWVRVLDGVSFDIKPRETLGVVGESGCGKSMTALSVMQLQAPRYSRLDGKINFQGRDLLKLSRRQMSRVRGRNISMIFQEPMSALDPVFTVGAQIRETVQCHFDVSKREADERAIEALDSVGIAAPRQIAQLYPMSLSGGMRQRVMIAMALVCEPDLLIADEPTTALDVTIQSQIMDLLLNLSQKRGTAIMFITHNLALVSQNCDRMITMYGGQIIEGGPVDDVLSKPLHPYTKGLVHSIPDAHRARGTLNAIPGRVPSLRAMPPGCRFEPRCTHAKALCQQDVAIEDIGNRQIRCHRWQELTSTTEGSP